MATNKGASASLATKRKEEEPRQIPGSKGDSSQGLRPYSSATTMATWVRCWTSDPRVRGSNPRSYISFLETILTRAGAGAVLRERYDVGTNGPQK